MRNFHPVIFAGSALLISGLITLLLLRILHKPWWQIRWVRMTSLLLPVFGVLGIFSWGIGEYNKWKYASIPGAITATVCFVAIIALMLSLPISGVLRFMNWISDRIAHRKRIETGETVDQNRRVFLKTAAAALPIITVASAVKGVGASFVDPKMETRIMRFPNLPKGLEGLKILQLSDLHLYHYITLSSLEEIVERANTFKPDIVLVTGDVADDLGQLPDALRLIDSLKAPFGTFASLGNHEYFRGIQEVHRLFDASPIPLMVNTGISIPVRGASLFVAAIDDPRSLGKPDPAFFERCIDSSLQQRSSESFTVLMSHRPNALDAASERNIDFVLAGHTHGGQVGFLGHSAFEPLAPEAYLWGEYHKKNTTMYTTSGAGHWFPFRLGCPREALIFELARA